jgi:hypothetical protein
MGIFNRNKENKSTSHGTHRSAPLPITKLYFDLNILDETDIPFITHSVSFQQINFGGQNFIGDGFLFYHKKLKMLFVCQNKWNDPDFETFLWNLDSSVGTCLVASNHELYTSELQDLGATVILSIRTHNRGHVSVFTHDSNGVKKFNTYINRYCIKDKDF